MLRPQTAPEGSSFKTAIDPPSARRLCPACSGPRLKPCVVEGHTVEVCPRCRGLWCEAAEWDPALLGTRPVAGETAERASNMVATGPSSLRCPGCVCTLTRVRVDAVKDLEIDQCDRCGGVWFDRSDWESLRPRIVLDPKSLPSTTHADHSRALTV